MPGRLCTVQGSGFRVQRLGLSSELAFRVWGVGSGVPESLEPFSEACYTMII